MTLKSVPQRPLTTLTSSFFHAMASRTRLFLCSLALSALVPVHAAELGDPRVASHIGQPLVADVELTLLEDPATPVQVRVASPEVYHGAGIAVPPVLASLNLSVMRRDGRQFLHVTSIRSVDADHVHLYLELVDRGQRAVRLATLWLTPDPNPAPPPAAVPAPSPARVPASAPASVPDAVLLAQVERARLVRAVPVSVPVPAPAAGPKAVPPQSVAVPRPRPAPAAKAPVLPVPAPDVHPQACARPVGEAQACAALGAKNDELRARLSQVEDRMKKLQATLGAPVVAAGSAGKPAPARTEGPKEGGATPAAAKAEAQKPGGDKPASAKAGAPKEGGATPAPAKTEAPKDAGDKSASAKTDAQKDGAEKAAAEVPKPVVPAGPRPIHSIKPLVPHKPKAPPPDDSLPWGWIGAAIGLLALGGAGVMVVRRRKAGGGDTEAVGTPGLLEKLKARFVARTRAPQPEEPTLE